MKIAPYLPLVLTGAVVAVIPMMYSSWVRRKSQRTEPSNSGACEFRVSWVFIFLAGLVIVGAIGFVPLCLYARGPRNTEAADVLLLTAFSGSFLALGVFGIYRFMKTSVEFCNEKVVFRHGRVEQTIELSDIDFVYTASGFICVDTGQKPRTVIPLIFSRNAEMLAKLQGAARNNRSGGTPRLSP